MQQQNKSFWDYVSTTCLRLLILIVSIIYIVIGLIFIGVGILAFSQIGAEWALIVFAILGGVPFLAGLFGTIGVVRKNACFLITYAILHLVLTIIQTLMLIVYNSAGYDDPSSYYNAGVGLVVFAWITAFVALLYVVHPRRKQMFQPQSQDGVNNNIQVQLQPHSQQSTTAQGSFNTEQSVDLSINKQSGENQLYNVKV